MGARRGSGPENWILPDPDNWTLPERVRTGVPGGAPPKENPGDSSERGDPIHDRYGRITPYEVAIPDEAFAEERFGAIREEGGTREEAFLEPGAFLMLGRVQEALRALRPADESEEAGLTYGAILFHAYHFWRCGHPTYLVRLRAIRYLMEAAPEAEAWTPRTPAPAGYVQLPRNLFWARSREEGPPERIDGFFWSLPEEARFSVLLATGMRRDRPGLSVVALPTLPLSEASTWIRARMREEGEDFESTLPGGEVERLYSVETTGEGLKLVARILWYMDAFPDAVGSEEAAPPPEGADGPRPSRLPYRPVGLEAVEGAESKEEEGGAE